MNLSQQEKTKKIIVPYSNLESDFRWKPRWYQKDFVSSEVRNRVLILHRRGGKTDCAFQDFINRAARKKGRYAFVEPQKTQAKKNVWREFMSKYVPVEIIKKKNENELYLELINGSQLYFEGANDNPDVFRGARFDGIVWDEVREIKPEVFDIVAPIMAESRGWQTFISTPNGRDHFWEFSEREKSYTDWKTWKFSAYDTKVFTEEELEIEKRKLSEDFFRQEYLCEFIEGGGEVFKKFRQCISDCLAPPSPYKLYRMGVDLGKSNDFTVCTVVDLHTWDIVAYERFNEIDWEIQMPRIEELAKRYNNAEVLMDATGVGDMICETLMYRGMNVKGIKFGKFNKNDMVMNLKTKFENSEIRIPKWIELESELEGYQEIRRADGVSSYKNGSLVKHDDCITSLLLAYWDLIAKLPMVTNNDMIIPNDDPFDDD